MNIIVAISHSIHSRLLKTHEVTVYISCIILNNCTCCVILFTEKIHLEVQNDRVSA